MGGSLTCHSVSYGSSQSWVRGLGVLHGGQNFLDSSGLQPGVPTLSDPSYPSPQSVVYCHGGRVGFFQGDIRLLSDDMKALRPTIFPVVPRLLNRMYDKVGPTDWKVLILWCGQTLGFQEGGFPSLQPRSENLPPSCVPQLFPVLLSPVSFQLSNSG